MAKGIYHTDIPLDILSWKIILYIPLLVLDVSRNSRKL